MESNAPLSVERAPQLEPTAPHVDASVPLTVERAPQTDASVDQNDGANDTQEPDASSKSTILAETGSLAATGSALPSNGTFCSPHAIM